MLPKTNPVVLSGKNIFKLMDTKGLPLDLITLELRQRQAIFNVVEFVEAALASKNFTYSKIKERLVQAMLPEFREDFIKELDAKFAVGDLDITKD